MLAHGAGLGADATAADGVPAAACWHLRFYCRSAAPVDPSHLWFKLVELWHPPPFGITQLPKLSVMVVIRDVAAIVAHAWLRFDLFQTSSDLTSDLL